MIYRVIRSRASFAGAAFTAHYDVHVDAGLRKQIGSIA
jgi:hypothetical protein